MEQYIIARDEMGLSEQEIEEAVVRDLSQGKHDRVLIIPPDHTRLYSGAGLITRLMWKYLSSCGSYVRILPALGTHKPMTAEEIRDMYGDIPLDAFLVHDWRNGVTKLGEVPADYMSSITDGLWQEKIDVEVSRVLLEKWDRILSVGQVVPHEVIGMSNHAKNIFVGTGGSNMINSSHMVGAVYGMERIMGRDYTPVRKIFDYGAEHYLNSLPIEWFLTVTTAPGGEIRTHGLFIGTGRDCLTHAVALAKEKNIIYPSRGFKKCVVMLEENEFKSTWLGNKAVYRTRMAMEDDGELLIIAPGVCRFGEDDECDRLIRKYGYKGRLATLEHYRQQEELQRNMSAAAHLIHGSSDGRFRIRYAVRDITREEIESVGFESGDAAEALHRYDPSRLTTGWNTLPDGEEIFFISNPSLGLWADRQRME